MRAAGAWIHWHVDGNNVPVDLTLVLRSFKSFLPFMFFDKAEWKMKNESDKMCVILCQSLMQKNQQNLFLISLIYTHTYICVGAYFLKIALLKIFLKILFKKKQKNKLDHKRPKQNVHSIHLLTRPICRTETCHYLALCYIPASFPPHFKEIFWWSLYLNCITQPC